jgi:hypothetical protein
MKTASFSTGAAVGRFDKFLAASSKVSVALSCKQSTDFYNAVTNSGLRFTDPGMSGTDFGLYSPTDYTSGSSVYHHDPARLQKDCETNKIPHTECSDIMTNELLNGYTQRNIGEPVRRMMLSILGSSTGPSAGNCAVPAGTSAGNGAGGGHSGRMSQFNLPSWALYAMGGVGFVGVALLGYAAFIMRSRRASPKVSESSVQ